LKSAVDELQQPQPSSDRLVDIATSANVVAPPPPSKLQRSQSERIKNRAKALMRRMDLRATTSSTSTKITKESIGAPVGLGNGGGPVMVTHAGGQAIINAVIGDDRRIGDQIPESSSDNDHQVVVVGTRRDSGVGSSLSRSPATAQPHGRQRQLRSSGRWNGMNATASNGAPSSMAMQEKIDGVRPLDSLCVAEMEKARKLALLKLTALLEKQVPSSGECPGVPQKAENEEKRKNRK